MSLTNAGLHFLEKVGEAAMLTQELPPELLLLGYVNLQMTWRQQILLTCLTTGMAGCMLTGTMKPAGPLWWVTRVTLAP